MSVKKLTSIDYEFTAKLEDELDAIARGEKDWIPLLQDFWTPFHTQVLDIDENVSRSEVAQARVLGADPKSGKEVSVRIGRYGPYAQIGTKDDEDKPKQCPAVKPVESEIDETIDEGKITPVAPLSWTQCANGDD